LYFITDSHGHFYWVRVELFTVELWDTRRQSVRWEVSVELIKNGSRWSVADSIKKRS